jgi:hypothetical protein
MAKTEVGSLSVRLTASATEFEKVIDGAQRRLVSFAAGAASPITFGSKIATMIGASAGGAGGIVAAAAGSIAKVIDPMSARIFDTEKMQAGMDAVIERTVTLAREAKKLDFTPQFLGAMKMSAGPDADAAITAIKRLERNLGEAVAGGNAESRNGQTSHDKFKRWGMDPVALSKMSSEDAFIAVGKRLSELHDHLAEAAMGFDLLGKSSAESIEAIKNFATDAEKSLGTIKELGLYNPEMVHLSRAAAKMEREHKARVAAYDAKEFGAWGAAKMEGEMKMKERGVFTSEYQQGLKQVKAALDVRNLRALGVDTTMDEMYPTLQSGAVHEARKAAMRPETGLSADQQKLANAKIATAEAADKLIEKLEKGNRPVSGRRMDSRW